MRESGGSRTSGAGGGPYVPRRLWSPPAGMGALAVGYFLAYIPFAALTRALSTGLLPGIDERVGGLVLLPAAAIGVLAGSAIFLVANGWWRYIGRREIAGRERRFPSRTMIGAGIAMALIIATTILNYTFVGVSILFMLLVMRAGTLCLAPLTDLVRGRRIRAYAWAGLALSLAAIAVALLGVDAYVLTAGAVLSLCAYFVGYAVRFRIMDRMAKTGDVSVDRRYFAEEQVTAAVAMVVVCAVLALIGAGPEMQALREGFTDFLLTPEALLALLVGLFYSCLYVFGTLIYLDPREFAWAVPINRASSVFSVAVAAYALSWLFGATPPHQTTLIAAGIVLMAIAALSWPQLRALVARKPGAVPARRLVLFVCRGNTGRSPTAAALMRAEVASWPADAADGVVAASAGFAVRDGGAPMAEAAVAALKELEIEVHPHVSQPLTPELCERAALIVCMTQEQREAVISIAPRVADRVVRLDPGADLPEPERESPESWLEFARTARELLRARLEDLGPPHSAASPA